MEKITVSFANVPENVPQLFTIEVGMKLYEKVRLYIPKINVPTVALNNRWYIYFYFVNPATKKKKKIQYYPKN